MNEEEKFNEMYYGDLGMCGCGHDEDLKEFIVHFMEIQSKYRSSEISYEEREKLIKSLITKNHILVFEFILHTLNRSDLMDHGSSVGGSWLTDKGELFLRLYRKYKIK